MTSDISILSINGSDSTGQSGIQTDVKTAQALGGYAYTAITSVTVQNVQGIASITPLPTDTVVGQIRAVYDDVRPKAVKVGMVNGADTIRQLRREIMGCRNIVASPVILSSDGTRLMDDDSVAALCRHILPDARLLIMKCQDAETMLGMSISTDADMLRAADRLRAMGVEWVMLRGGKVMEGRVTALLHGDTTLFFSSYNIKGWQRHGISGASSAAITMRLAMGDGVVEAVGNAHEYLHNQIIYSVEREGYGVRPQELYNKYLSLIAQHYRSHHDVARYADLLAISPRYLSQITKAVVGKQPKQIINEYLLQESKNLLQNTSMSIQEISDALGFSSPILFSRFVRQLTTQTPREVRRSAKA